MSFSDSFMEESWLIYRHKCKFMCQSSRRCYLWRVDALTDILSTVRLRGALHTRLEASPPWGIDFAASEKLRFALVSHGFCHLVPGGGSAPIPLKRGDGFLLVGPEPFSLRDRPQSQAQPCATVVDRAAGGFVKIGDGPAATSLVLGWFTFEPGSSSLLRDLLPPITCFSLSSPRFRTTQAALDLLSAEASSDAPGADLVVGRVGDILLVEAIRAHLANSDVHEAGLVCLLADRRIARALQAIHADAGHAWTLAELAHIAGMSRSSLAAEFRRKAGQPVMDYVVRWRMRLACMRLRDSSMPLSRIAREVGYEAESAFGRAFKRIMKITPGAYRRSMRGRGGEGDREPSVR
ncbi:MAG: AraC family transcriptional regulator [Ottowia sp.]|uniref:AraC family transcriptional regulator n=1 Tax=Ottowia sp. TaxID=1898956 RepID=UPI0039E66570